MRAVTPILPLSILIVSLSLLGPQAVSSAASLDAPEPGPITGGPGVHQMPLVNGDLVVVSVAADGSTTYHLMPRPVVWNGAAQPSVVTVAGERGDRLDDGLLDVGYLVREGYYLLDGLPVILEASDASRLPELGKLVAHYGGEARVLSPALAMVAAELPFPTLETATLALLARGDVEKIWLDRVVRPSLDVSVPVIGAPQLWAGGNKGEGMAIAILDSGIDSTHPDLDDLDDVPSTDDPKVVLAVDFTNEGTTADGHGHGSHVAGIAAGTGFESGGTYTGAAPGAYLWNLRVLRQDGVGQTSWIVAALEFASLGPDMMLGGDDEADVANMSLGSDSTGSGDDPLSQAVDLAVSRGLAVVVSAGNTGPEMGTVTRPGVARKAITVGATDDVDQMASFSSRGPTSDLRLKPDLVAPGRSIVSVKVGGGTRTLSGTSMAAPHVSGAAALLLHAHPDWDPAMVKAALMNHALPLDGPRLLDQGAGRVRLPESVGATLLALEPSFSFGVMTSGDEVSRPIELVNLSDSPVTADLSTLTTVDGAGTSDLVTVSPASVEVPAGGRAQVLLTVGPVRRHAAGWYEGRLTAIYSGGALTVPYLAKVEQSSSIDVRPASITRTLGLFQRGTDALTITNPGTADISFQVDVRPAPAAAVTGPLDDVTWVCLEPLLGVVGPSSSRDVTVTTNCLRDLALGGHAAEIVVTSNDPERPTVVVPLAVEVEVGAPPEIQASPSSFDMELSIDQRLTAPLEVANLDTGDAGGVLRYMLADLEPVFVTNAPWLSQEPASGYVEPGTSDQVAIVFDATGLSTGSYRSLILLSSNDPDEPHILVPVGMTVLAPDVEVSPSSLDLGTLDRDQTATTALEVQNHGPGSLFYELDPQVPWLLPGTGHLGAGETRPVVVTADSTGRAPGVHTGDLLVRSNDPDEDPVVIQARLAVLAPEIRVTPVSFDLGTLDRDKCAGRDLTIANSGDGTLVFDVSGDGLDLQQGSGTGRLPPGAGSLHIHLSMCATGVDPGSHSLGIVVQSNDLASPAVRVPVNVDVPAPWIRVSGSLSATLDSDDSVRRNINITNSGDGTLAFEIATNIPWLFPLTTGGHVPPGGTGDIEFLIRALGRDPGIYAGTLVIRTNDPLRSTLLRGVSLTVLAPVMGVSPTSVAVALGGDERITVADLTITNSGEGTLVMQASTAETSSPPPTPPPPTGGEAVTQPPWLSVTPSQASVRTGESVTLEVTIDRTSLSDAGPYTGTVVIDSNDLQRTPTVIPVTLAVDWALVTGRVTLQGQQDHSGITLVFSQGSTTTATTETDANGDFVTVLEPGTYRATALHRYHLPWHAHIEVAPLETLELGANLIPGDWNGDGVIDILDIIIMVKNLSRTRSP